MGERIHEEIAASAGPGFQCEILNERAGFCFARLGRSVEAGHFFPRAMEIYKYEWGAVAD